MSLKKSEFVNEIVSCDVCTGEISNNQKGTAQYFFHGGVKGIIQKQNVNRKLSVAFDRGVQQDERELKAGFAAFPDLDICSAKCFKKAFADWAAEVSRLLEEKQAKPDEKVEKKQVKVEEVFE